MSTIDSTNVTTTNIRATNVQDASGGNSSTPANILAGSVKAWVPFDGSAGTISPAASFNVASLTDNGNGDYTVNIDTDFGSANWCATGLCDAAGTAWGGMSFDNSAVKTAGTVRVQCWDDVKNSSGHLNPAVVDVMCIGVQ